jgi:hypothetical protein
MYMYEVMSRIIRYTMRTSFNLQTDVNLIYTWKHLVILIDWFLAFSHLSDIFGDDQTKSWWKSQQNHMIKTNSIYLLNCRTWSHLRNKLATTFYGSSIPIMMIILQKTALKMDIKYTKLHISKFPLFWFLLFQEQIKLHNNPIYYLIGIFLRNSLKLR